MGATWYGPEPDIRCDGDRGTHRWCTSQATHVSCSLRFGDGAAVAICGAHGLDMDRVPIIRDPRVAACVVAALTGATPYRWPVGLLRAGVVDPSMLLVALDHIEERGLYLPDAWPTDAGVDWPRADKHGTGDNPHMWITAIGVGINGSRGEMSVGPGGPLVRRCPCGLFEHEARPCPECGGEGYTVEPADGYRTCPECRGSGLVAIADDAERFLGGSGSASR